MLVFSLLIWLLSACAQTPARPATVTWEQISGPPAPPADQRIQYGDHPLAFGELRLPRGSGPHPVVVVVHGGCWQSQYDLKYMSHLSAALAKAGIATWTLEYRRIGNAGGGWTGTFDDVARGTDYVRTLAQKFPLDVNRVVVAGHSAGGHLALWLAARRNLPRESPLFTANPLPLRGVVSLAGITDLRKYGAGTGSCNASVTPLLGGLPQDVPSRYAQTNPSELLPFGVPLHLIHGALDPYVPVEQSRDFAALARSKGDKAEVVLIQEIAHFDLVAPFAEVWNRIQNEIVSLMSQSSDPSHPSHPSHMGSFMRPCQIPNVTGEARCGRLEVYENRETKKGRKIALNIQILPALNAKTGSDPLFFLAGGPGGPATGLARFANDTFAAVRKERDIVFVDQRGTGASNPLTCLLYGETLQGHLGDLIPLEKLEACRREWEERADLRFYTTTIAVHDLDEVRAALGYEKINLFGTSYGTRVAQEYMRRYPDRVRAVILKGSTAISDGLAASIAVDAQRALDILIADCANDENCRTVFPNLKKEFEAVLDRFASGDVTVEIRESTGSPAEKVELSRGAFATTLRSLLQSAQSAAQIPKLIHQAFENDFAPYVQWVRTLRTNSPVGSGTFMSVVATEDLSIANPVQVKQRSAGTFMGDYYYQQLVRGCRDFPRGNLPRDFHVPVKSSVPVLFVSGHRDPATPPENADSIARHLSNSLHVVARYAHHSYTGFAPCADKIMAEFIVRGTTRGLDTSCVNHLPQVPFER